MAKIQLRRALAAEWTALDPTLAEGEIGVNLSTLQIKVGNGTDAWTDLPYASGGNATVVNGVLAVHYAAGWDVRPTDDDSVTVIWIGGTPSTPPTDGITGVDLWYVPTA